MWNTPRTTLQEFVIQPAPGGCFGAISSIEKLAAWHARKGCVSIVDCALDEGWSELRRFFDYRTWSVRTHLQVAELVRAPEAAFPTWTPFQLLGIALALHDCDKSRWLGELLIRSRVSKLIGRRWGSERRDPFQCYICELFCRYSGTPSHPDDFGPYAVIYHNWERSADLENAISSACEYHVKQIKTDGEFENNPHDIFPSEILALYRVREKLGLETPWVNHPLLDTPFTQVPEKITYEPDPLVIQAMDLVTKLLPEAVSKR